MLNYIIKKSICGVICALPMVAFASNFDGEQIFLAQSNFEHEQYQPSESNISTEKVSYIPRAYLSGYIGTEVLGEGDLLIPLYTTGDKALILYSQARYVPESGDDSWSAGTGLLYRFVVPRINSVLGLYVLGDYNRITSGQEYYDINPGIEVLGEVWDFHANGYIPVGKKSWSKEIWAENFFGNRNYIRDAGYDEYDHKILQYSEIGLGGDIEVGRKLFKVKDVVVKGYVQGYYFNMDRHSDVVGGGLKLKVDATEQVSLIANYTYDNYQHSVFMAGIQVKLNGLFSKSNNKVSENIAHRLFDRIDRNYANISTGTRTLVTKGNNDLGEYFRRYIFVVDPINPSDPTYERGTWENPYDQSDLEKLGLQGILDYAHNKFKQDKDEVKVYFAPYTYSANALTVYKGMSIEGKLSSTKSIDDKVSFIGSMTLLGDNELSHISLKNIDINNTNREVYEVGITISDKDNVVLDDVEIGTHVVSKDGVDSYIDTYIIGIKIDNSHNVALKNSRIYSYQSGQAKKEGGMNATAIMMLNRSSLTVSDSKILGIASETLGKYDNTGNAYGIYADGRHEGITIKNSVVKAQAKGGKDNSGNGYGILVDNDEVGKNEITVVSSMIEGNGSNNIGKFSGNGYGIHTEGKGDEITIQNNSNVLGEGKGKNDFSGNGYGIFIGNNYYNFYVNGLSDSEVKGNKIKVLSSSIINGTGNSSLGVFSGNGYGLLVGHGYQYINESHKDKEKVESSVNANEIIITNSNLTGIGGGEKNTNYSGNGYGMAVGSGTIYLERYSSDANAFDINSSIFNNNIVVTNSNLKGKGEINIERSKFSGNGYALLIGNGTFWVEATTAFTSLVDLSIHDNVPVIFGGSLVGNSHGLTYSSNLAGDSFGLLVGYDGWYYEDYSGNKKVKVNFDIANNNIKIDSSKVLLNSQDEASSGSSYGIVIGCKANENNIVIKKEDNNKLNIDKTAIDIDLSNNGYYRNAYGVIAGGWDVNIDEYTKGNITRSDKRKEGKKIDAGSSSAKW